MAYCTADGVRDLMAAFATKDDAAAFEFTDQKVEEWGDNWADPIIDGVLRAAGYTPPTGTVPALIASISAMLSAAHGLRSHTGRRTASNIESAQTLIGQAWELLEKIHLGTIDPGIDRSAEGEPILYDTDPETRHANAAVDGVKPEDWTWPAETRA